MVKRNQVLVVLWALAVACSGKGSSLTPTSAQAVSVSVSPAEATIAPGGQQTFSASVTGAADTTVTWSVEEGDAGGTISSSGVYSAPGLPGTYHVVATSQADATATASAVVTVAGTPTVVVAVDPKVVSLVPGASEQFTATVTGSSNTAVSWSVEESSGCGSVSSSGLYTAPPAAATCHVAAKSLADGSKTDIATVTVTPSAVTVTVSPGSAAVEACHTLQLSASVTGSSSTGVTWSVQEGAAGGSISSSGLYTAPSTDGVYHAVAVSQASGTASASAALTVTNQILSVSVSPATVTVPAGGSVQLAATITTSCGTLAATQVVTAGAH